jgi:hypothetical protein
MLGSINPSSSNTEKNDLEVDCSSSGKATQIVEKFFSDLDKSIAQFNYPNAQGF